MSVLLSVLSFISIDHCRGHIEEFSCNQGKTVKGEKSYVSDYLSCNEMDLYR